MEETKINILGEFVKVRKQVHIIRNDRKEKIAEKIVYYLPMQVELYKKIPNDIITIDNKKFYKTPINNINQEYFKLIEC